MYVQLQDFSFNMKIETSSFSQKGLKYDFFVLRTLRNRNLVGVDPRDRLADNLGLWFGAALLIPGFANLITNSLGDNLGKKEKG